MKFKLWIEKAGIHAEIRLDKHSSFGSEPSRNQCVTLCCRCYICVFAPYTFYRSKSTPPLQQQHRRLWAWKWLFFCNFVRFFFGCGCTRRMYTMYAGSASNIDQLKYFCVSNHLTVPGATQTSKFVIPFRQKKSGKHKALCNPCKLTFKWCKSMS